MKNFLVIILVVITFVFFSNVAKAQNQTDIHVSLSEGAETEQVKIFFGKFGSGHDVLKTEKEINDWLKQMKNQIEITRIIQNVTTQKSFNDTFVVITIFYKKK